MFPEEHAYVKQLEQRIASLEAELAASQAFKTAVIDELVTLHIYNDSHEADPRKAVNDAISYHCQVALDPEVSSDAAALVTEARREGLRAAAEIAKRYGNADSSDAVQIALEIHQAAERKE